MTRQEFIAEHRVTLIVGVVCLVLGWVAGERQATRSFERQFAQNVFGAIADHRKQMLAEREKMHADMQERSKAFEEDFNSQREEFHAKREEMLEDMRKSRERFFNN